MPSLAKHARTLLLALVALLPAVALTGCFQSEAGLVITGDDQVEGKIRITPQSESAANFLDWTPPQGMEDRISVEVTDHNTGSMSIRLQQLNFDEVRDLVRHVSRGTIDIDIERTTAGQVTMTGSADFESYPTAYTGLAITFPEAIINANGVIHDDTVQWELKGGENSTFWASSPAGLANRNQLLIWIGVAAAVGILASILVALWARRTHDMEGF